MEIYIYSKATILVKYFKIVNIDVGRFKYVKKKKNSFVTFKIRKEIKCGVVLGKSQMHKTTSFWDLPCIIIFTKKKMAFFFLVRENRVFNRPHLRA